MNTSRRKFLGAAAASALILPGRASAAAPILIDAARPGRVFEGIGALSAGASSRLLIDYPEPARAQVLDLIFKPGFGASLPHLKVEIGGDVNSTDGVEPSHMHSRDDQDCTRGYEWWLMKEARARRPGIMLDTLAWGAPGWIGNGNYYSQDMADYVVKFLRGARDTHGLEIDYTGIWNEVNYDKEWIKLLKRTLQAAGLATKLIAADQTPWHPKGLWGIVDDMNADPELMAAVDVVGSHYPFYKNYQTTEAARACGKPLWASEDGFSQKKTSCDDFASALWLARFFNMNYVGGRMTKTIVWSVVSSYYDSFPYRRSGLMVANTPWSGNFEDSATLWATAHTTQFADPGWTYLDSACRKLRAGGSVVALRKPGTEDYSLVIETGGAHWRQKARFQTAGLADAPLSIWRTDQAQSFARIGEARPAAGEFTVDLEPNSIYSLTTTTGQRKGGCVPPTAADFPLPFADDFSAYPAGATPRYFSDWFGVFAVEQSAEGPCLVQQLTQKPIDWGFVKNGEPRTYVGGERWRDYTVSVEADSNGAGQVGLFGRVSKLGMSNLPGRDFELRLTDSGAWSLRAGKGAIAAGRVEAKPGWRRLTLEFRGSRVRASIDGREVAAVTSTHSPAGMVGLGSGLGKARFRALRVA